VTKRPSTSFSALLCALCMALAAPGDGRTQILGSDDGILSSGHPALVVLQDPSYPLLVEALQTLPGFAGAAPDIDGSYRIVALFDGAVPPALPDHLVPSGWVLHAFGNLEFQRLGVAVDASLEEEEPASHGPPVPSDSIGIGPGSTLLTNFFDPVDNASYIGICSAAHVMRDRTTGRLYLSAAGHCFMGETFATTHGPDADWDRANTTRVRVCVEGCLGGGSGLVSGAFGVYPGTTRDIGVGPVKLDYARQRTGAAAVGHDFGIVEIPPELCGEIRTDMPVWGGPGSADTSRRVQQGDLLVHYGNSVGLGEVFPQKGRAGIGMGSNDLRWLARLAAFQGDSGSALNIATVSAESLVEGEHAGGVLTHIIITPDTGALAGTNTARGIQMAAADAGFDLELVHTTEGLCGNGGTEPPVVTAIADDDPAIEYRKGWHRRSDAAASGGGYHRRIGAGGGGEPPTARLVFSGHQVTYFYGTSAQGGAADLFLDGELVATVDYSGPAPGSSPDFDHSVTLGGLEEGNHELVIAVRSGAAYVDGFEVVSEPGGGADTAAAGTQSVTTTSQGTLAGVGSTVRVASVEVGPDDEWLSVVVEGADPSAVTVSLLDPLGTLLGLASQLVAGSSAVGVDLSPARAGTYTVQVAGGLTAPPPMEISMARAVTVEGRGDRARPGRLPRPCTPARGCRPDSRVQCSGARRSGRSMRPHTAS
jgi:hypothetical protein